MAKKKRPRTAEAYAKYLYMAEKCTGAYCGTYNDHAIVDTRVRAFVDGVNWERRRRSAEGKSGEPR
jgi:hypothetical protein